MHMDKNFRKRSKALLWRLASWGNAAHFAIHSGAVVAGLHRVAAPTREAGLDCPPALFEELCAFWARNFRVVSLPQLAADLREGRSVAGQLALTFDDGYKDNLDTAAPILQKYGLTATFFITSGFIDATAQPWWDQNAGDPRPILTWENIRQLSGMGFDIGAHTRTHPDLSTLPVEDIRSEVEGCRQDILNATGVCPISFAYPFGGERQITQQGRRIVQEAGFTCCCSLYGGITKNTDNPYEIKRIPVSDWYISGAHFGGDILIQALKQR